MDNRPQQQLVDASYHLTAVLPAPVIEQLAATLLDADKSNWPGRRARILNAILQPAARDRVSALLDAWQTVAPDVSGASVALALLTAARVQERHRQEQQIELVWTGPNSQVIPLRRTDQALLQLINESTVRLTIISFAVYRAEAIARAILSAAKRNVDIAICLETPDASEGRMAFDTIHALGNEVVQHARIYVWPLDQRPLSSAGRHGSLHAKVAVADGKSLFISSANLTEYAMTLNMELGVLIRGGELPSRVEEHFGRLIETGILRPM